VRRPGEEEVKGAVHGEDIQFVLLGGFGGGQAGRGVYEFVYILDPVVLELFGRLEGFVYGCDK